MDISLREILWPYQKQVETALFERVSTWGSPKQIQEACQYALTQGGKRFRPALVLMMAKALGSQFEVLEAALAIEYFHTASLIADDLPCMDDDHERRGKPSTHRVYGEGIALLASYALIAAGYEGLAKNSALLKQAGYAQADEVGVLALQNASVNTGIKGATGGQCLDLYPPKIDLATYKETILKKTVSLFEISFVFGWLFGGGDPAKLSLVKEAAYHYGMAFQIADDFDDAKEDLLYERSMNLVSLVGTEKASAQFQKEVEAYFKSMQKLDVDSTEFNALAEYLEKELSTRQLSYKN